MANTIDIIIGTRPNFVKIRPIIRELGNIEYRLIHTGQHYDYELSELLIKELGITAPDFNLEVGSSSQGKQTGEIIIGYEDLLLNNETKPVGVVVAGDVNSTMACSIAAVKMGIPVAHVEAGLRSFDRCMPEEINRIITDSISSLLFVTEPDGLINLTREGITHDKIHYVGNLMIDTLINNLKVSTDLIILEKYKLQKEKYLYMTLHRPSNVDDYPILEGIMKAVCEISSEIPVIFSVHPRTKNNLLKFDFDSNQNNIQLVPSLGYENNIKLIKNSKAVLTDSGGIQEETSFLNIPCLTLRDNTERPITVEFGTSALIGNKSENIIAAWEKVKNNNWKQGVKIPLWDGFAAKRIVEVLKKNWSL